MNAIVSQRQEFEDNLRHEVGPNRMNLYFEEMIIRDFRSFRGEHHLVFTDEGLIYVTGDNQVEPELTTNGSGKSTIFDALSWCLFGRTLRNARPGDSVEPWYDAVDHTNVQVIFNCRGVQYVLDRGRKPNFLILHDENVTQDAVDKAIGLSYEAFINCVVIGQFNEMFLSLRAEEQTALFTELLDLDVWVRSVENAAKALKASEQLLDNAQTNMARTEGSLTEISAQLTLATKNHDMWNTEQAAALARCQKAVEDVQAEYGNLQKARPKAVDTREDEAAVLDGQNELPALRASLRGYRADKQDLVAKRASQTTELKSIERQLAKYNTTPDVCPECGQAIGAEHIEEKKTKLLEEVDVLTRQLNDNTVFVAEAEGEVTRTEDEIGEVEMLISNLKEHIARDKADITAYEHKLEMALQKRNGAIQDFTTRQKYTNPHEESIKKLDAREVELKDRVTILKLEINKQEAHVKNIRFWQDSFKQIRLNLIDETLSELQFAVMRHAETFGMGDWSIQFLTERETAKGDVRNKFTVMIQVPHRDEAVPMDSLSGGELQRWQLACALGLADVLLNRAGLTCNLLVLDEPTRHMSQAGTEDLIECLGEMAKERAVFFIDHHTIDSGAFSRVLKVTKTEEGSSLSWI